MSTFLICVRASAWVIQEEDHTYDCVILLFSCCAVHEVRVENVSVTEAVSTEGAVPVWIIDERT